MFYYLYSCICVYIISNVRDLAGLSFDRRIDLELTTSKKGHRRLRIKRPQRYIFTSSPRFPLRLSLILEWSYSYSYRNTHCEAVTARHGLQKGLFGHSSHGRLGRRRLART